MYRYPFFRRQVIQAAVTVAFGVAFMAAFYHAFGNMCAEQQAQSPTPGF